MIKYHPRYDDVLDIITTFDTKEEAEATINKCLNLNVKFQFEEKLTAPNQKGIAYFKSDKDACFLLHKNNQYPYQSFGACAPNNEEGNFYLTKAVDEFYNYYNMKSSGENCSGHFNLLNEFGYSWLLSDITILKDLRDNLACDYHG